MRSNSLKYSGTMRFDNYHLSKIPLASVSGDKKNRLVDLVKQILKEKDSSKTNNTLKQEKNIDLLVYELYGLTKKEIEVIEDGMKSGKKDSGNNNC